MASTPEQDAWLVRVLGARLPAAAPPGKAGATPHGGGLRPATGQPLLANPPGAHGAHQGNLLATAKRTGAVHVAPPDPRRPQTFAAANGRQLELRHLPGGRVSLKAPPPPVSTVTFSGGGAKGAALPGAVRALHDSGVLAGVHSVAGASVGSMTAALVASGITPDEFAAVGNDERTTTRITEVEGGAKLRLLGAALKNAVFGESANPITGAGLEQLVRDVMDATLRKRMLEYVQRCATDSTPPAPEVMAVLNRLADNHAGPTFMDLRVLSRAMPGIKELVVTGTYIAELTPDDDERMSKAPGSAPAGQLYVFDADSEPDLEVAVAVHVSASFPRVFKPVDLKIADGRTVRFIDGGVMNNTPTDLTLGRDRQLDPIPSKRGITFVFEDEKGVAQSLLAGKVSPERQRQANLADGRGMLDRLRAGIASARAGASDLVDRAKSSASDYLSGKFAGVGSTLQAADYELRANLAQRPQELVMVPLRVPGLPSDNPDDKGTEIDMRDGTLRFDLPLAQKQVLQGAAEQATRTQIQREQGDQSHDFASDAQMLMEIPIENLAPLVEGGYAGAAQALTFRTRVLQALVDLRRLVRGPANRSLAVPEAALQQLEMLDQLTEGNAERQAFLARELNKGGLDSLVATAGRAAQPNATVQAAVKVAAVVAVRERARAALSAVVYPKLASTRPDGVAAQRLTTLERAMRRATTRAQLNAALDAAIADYSKDTGMLSFLQRDRKQFATALARWKMPERD